MQTTASSIRPGDVIRYEPPSQWIGQDLGRLLLVLRTKGPLVKVRRARAPGSGARWMRRSQFRGAFAINRG
jgi:hypothetical protein